MLKFIGQQPEALCSLSLRVQSQLIDRGDISSVQLVEAHLKRCSRLNPTLNAFITILWTDAIQSARVADQEIRAGHYRGPLHGIPIAHKDIIDTAFVTTTYGSSLYRNNVPSRNATVVTKLEDAGAILLGKCNLDEFAGSAIGDNPWYGRILNPWGGGRSPSGSSGGSAVAVAANLCSGATGSDTGGSIRNPAACTGIVGLKPTQGLVSVAGTFPLCPTLDVIGPFARTSADLAILLEAMAGFDPGDAVSADREVPSFPAMLEEGISEFRVALCPDLHFATLDQGVENALTKTANIIRHMGVMVESIEFPNPMELATACDVVFRAEAYSTHRDLLASHPDGYSEAMARRVLDGAKISHDDYANAIDMRRKLRQTCKLVMKDLDALVLPISPTAGPPAHDGSCFVNGKQETYGPVGRTMRMWVNLLGLPALALPMGLIDGMPIGFQLVGKPFSEAALLRLGHAYEVAIGDRDRPPF